VFLAGVCGAEYSPAVSASVVVDAKNCDVIYSYNADVKTQPASLAKMMTLLLTFKALQRGVISLNTMISISPHAASQSPSVLGLKSGESISVRDAILALIVKSANDIAVALAERIGKSESLFVAMMNREAKRLGMKSTTFCNSSGWKDPRQQTTANDMVKLAKALLDECPGYYHYFSNKQFYLKGKCIKGHNALLGKRGDIIVDGIKTGFVNASGFNLATSAVKGKNRLIAVVLGGKTSRERDNLMDILLKKGFLKLKNLEMLKNRQKSSKAAQNKSDGQPKIVPALDRQTVPDTLGIYNKISKLTQNNEIKNE
jgi:D-alanyl-D-alanine carboxypeptidase